MTEQFVSPHEQPPVDERVRFRRILARVVEERKASPDWRPVEGILHDLGDGAPAVEASGITKAPPRIGVILVSGVLWECVSDAALPFGSGLHGLPDECNSHDRSYLADYDYLKEAGVNAEVLEVVRVQGIATSERNAGRVIEALERWRHVEFPVVIVSYSKGVPDTLAALLELGDRTPSNLRAVVSVAGVVSGSPLGDWLDTFRFWISLLPHPCRCKRVDKDFLYSITRRRCRPWLKDNWAKMPKHVSFSSLAVFEEPQDMHWFLRLLYARLVKEAPRNDSHVPIEDQVFPGGRLLGYVRADHWSCILPFNRSSRSFWNTLLRHNNAFPREIVFEAILRYLGEFVV